MDYVENKEDCMKATGIVRRIDDLGRIVIPKEIRRTLRIRETDPMEIYTDMDGQIVLKKYSPMADVSEFAVEYAESIAQNTGMTIAITDRDCVIAAAGTQKKNVQGKHITKELNDIMDKRQSVVASASENDYVKAVTDYDCEVRGDKSDNMCRRSFWVWFIMVGMMTRIQKALARVRKE